MLPSLSDEDIAALDPRAKAELLSLLEEQERRLMVEKYRTDFLAFCKKVYPGFKVGPHHVYLAKLLKQIIEGKTKRLTVSLPPRFGKSETISYLFAAFYLGHFPRHKVMMVTHTATLSESFGRRVRNLINSAEYQEIFPDTKVAEDQKAAGNWRTSQEGEYYAVGVGGAVAGRGADLLLCDDLISEQAMLGNFQATFDTAWTYLQTGPIQRLMPGGVIVMIATRWGVADPIGRALAWARNNPNSPQWVEVRFPALIERKVENADGTESLQELSLWPEQWPLGELLAKKASMAPQYWNAQYMQEPTAEGAQIIKRSWWRIWEKETPPKCYFVIASYDTAFEEKTSADYSAGVIVGVFDYEDERNKGISTPMLIVLDAWQKRVEFPELKKLVLEDWKAWKPDVLQIERKASGAPLIQELRRSGIPVSDVSVVRGTATQSNDKIARTNAVAPIFESGRVWIPDMQWAHELVEQMNAFPVGEHDDLHDAMVHAVRRFREGGFVSTQMDGAFDDDEDQRYIPRRRTRPYGMLGT